MTFVMVGQDRLESRWQAHCSPDSNHIPQRLPSNRSEISPHRSRRHGHSPARHFSEKLSEAARQRLVSLGIDVRLGKPVQSIDADGVVIGEERIQAKTVVWTAGVPLHLPGNG